MKRTLFVLLTAGVALVAGSRVQAHHSFAATYFEDQTESIEGNLVQFLEGARRVWALSVSRLEDHPVSQQHSSKERSSSQRTPRACGAP